MQAGRIEPGKNQAMLCWALRHTDMPIVLIGGSKHWPSYAELCRSISGSTANNHRSHAAKPACLGLCRSSRAHPAELDGNLWTW